MKRRFVLRFAACAALCCSAASCGADDVTASSPALPQGLVDCAAPPASGDLQARLWVSGLDAPCPLVVDDNGVSGSCTIPPGIARTLSIDWFIDVGGTTIVLAQGDRVVDLTSATEAEEALAFSADDYRTTDCRDLSTDRPDGAATVLVDGIPRPVCDLDDDGIDNLSQLCSGRDPLGRL
jgi:hypothetical protein